MKTPRDRSICMEILDGPIHQFFKIKLPHRAEELFNKYKLYKRVCSKNPHGISSDEELEAFSKVLLEDKELQETLR
jgi:hypothetical protein